VLRVVTPAAADDRGLFFESIEALSTVTGGRTGGQRTVCALGVLSI